MARTPTNHAQLGAQPLPAADGAPCHTPSHLLLDGSWEAYHRSQAQWVEHNRRLREVVEARLAAGQEAGR